MNLSFFGFGFSNCTARVFRLKFIFPRVILSTKQTRSNPLALFVNLRHFRYTANKRRACRVPTI